MTKIAMLLLSIAAIQYGFIPPIVDLTSSHVFHPDWPPHAKFHMVWLLFVGALMAVCVLVALWHKPNEQKAKHAVVIGCVVLGGFFASVLTRNGYGGALSGLEKPIQIFGIDGNIASFSITAVLQIIGTIMLWHPKWKS